jgi:hypothetical protein
MSSIKATFLRGLLLSLVLYLSPISTAPVYTAEFTALGCPNTTSPIATVTQQLEALTDFAHLLYLEHRSAQAFSTYVAKNLINHAFDVSGDGAALALSTVGPLLASATCTLEQIFVGQDRGMTFFKAVSPQGTLAAMDMFRMSGTCLVEHWIVEMPVTNSSNPHPYF